MKFEIAKLDIDEVYKTAIKEASIKFLSYEQYKGDLKVMQDIYETSLNNHDSFVMNIKNIIDQLESIRDEYFVDYHTSYKATVEQVYKMIDEEVETVRRKGLIQKDNKKRIIETKMEIVQDFKERKKEILLIIQNSIEIEYEKIQAGKSSWTNIEDFITDLKAKTLPKFNKEQEEVINPYLVEIKGIREEIQAIEESIMVETELINGKYSKELLRLSKEVKQEELRVIVDLHRKTINYLETQLQNSRNDLKEKKDVINSLKLKKMKSDGELRKKVLVQRKELLNEINVKLENEFVELDNMHRALDSFDALPSKQVEFKQMVIDIKDSIIKSDPLETEMLILEAKAESK